MALVARTLLDDCRIALQMLEDETDLVKWRVHWAGAVALLRAVGHVLAKVDGRNEVVKVLAAEAFSRWKAGGVGDEIFREFIDLERNNILKEYRFSHHPLDEVHVAVSFRLRDQESGEIREVVDDVPIGDNIYRPLVEGFREGDDARDVLADAIDWWDAEICKLEAGLLPRPSAEPEAAFAGQKKADYVNPEHE